MQTRNIERWICRQPPCEASHLRIVAAARPQSDSTRFAHAQAFVRSQPSVFILSLVRSVIGRVAPIAHSYGALESMLHDLPAIQKHVHWGYFDAALLPALILERAYLVRPQASPHPPAATPT